MNPAQLALVDGLVWAALSATVGFAATLLGANHIPAVPLTRLERRRRVYRVVGIHRWKHRLPEAGAVFGGVSKRSLPALSTKGIATFEVEARRAELVHWVLLASGPAFVLWNPWYLSTAMLIYAIVANVPCLIVQRHNRSRIEALTQRKEFAL